MKLLCLSSMAALIIGAALVSTAMPANAQSNDVTNRLNRLENELQTLNRAVYKGEKPEMPVYSTTAPDTAAQVEVRLQQMDTQIRELTGRVEEQNHAIYELKQLLESQKQASVPVKAPENLAAAPAPDGDVTEPVMVDDANQSHMGVNADKQTPVNPLGLNFKAPDDPAGMKTVAPGGSAVEATAQYEEAYAYLKSEKYDQAQKGFEAFLADHTDHVLAANAKYWLGETYYAQGDYKKSSRVFAEGFQKYPDSAKSADILLKLGMSLAGMGKTKEACVALAQLPIKFPSGVEPVVNMAEQEMKKLNCSS